MTKQKYEKNKINILDTNKNRTWKELKKITNDEIEKNKDLLLIIDKNDSIEGKPQLISSDIQTIPLVKRLQTRGSDFTKSETSFIDDSFDGRRQKTKGDNFNKDFYKYRVKYRNKPYFLLSEEKLKNTFYKFEGKIIEMDDCSEFSKSLKINSFNRIFLVVEAKPFAEILDKKELIEFSKFLKNGIKWDKQGFLDYIFQHENANIYLQPDEINLLFVAHFLSSKYEGYPLSILLLGPGGGGKTCIAECFNRLFKESKEILEAGNSTIKSMIPSFRERPANPGYLVECVRYGIIDELFKMVEGMNKQPRMKELGASYLGQLNMILEHKRRVVGSGNENQMEIEATAKFFFASNNMSGKNTLKEHLEEIEYTTLSRLLIYVQDKEHLELINKNKGLIGNNNNTLMNNDNKYISNDVIINWKNKKLDAFLTIFDTCNSFLSEYDYEKVQGIFKDSLSLVEDSLKKVWKARGLHHIILLLDGITKFRCIFEDYDESFVATEKDYENLRKVVTRVLNSWKINIPEGEAC
ncbi:MAG: hypothetical protein OEL87_01480 [Nanoarchaeota archaeon]|nr:hypothetical protein [Nanoarchaeota archaeon]